MRAYLETIWISRRYRLMLGMLVLSLALVSSKPPIATALPFEPLGSGSIHMTSLGFFTGGGTVTTLDNDTISFSFGATSFGHVGPTGASANWFELGFSGVGITTHTGETFFRTCSTSGIPTPCTFLGTFFSMSMSAPSLGRVQPGDDLTTVDGTYHLTLHAIVYLENPYSAPVLSFLTENEGPASLTFAPDPFTNLWRFRSGEAQVFTPEPTTLLLFGTTAAGLGLARWYRRRAPARRQCRRGISQA